VPPFFEESPWLLVPLVIVIVEVWNALKRLVVRSRRSPAPEQNTLS
jgi:hypothetical protein